MTAQTLRREDEAARRLARTNFDVPIALEAGAGTGKTAALVARVAAWVLDGGWEKARAALGPDATPSRIAARALERVAMLTFTDKAAVEMELRIAEALRALAHGDEVIGWPSDELPLGAQERRARARTLLGELDRLSVQTLHAWSSALLARHALAAGLHPAFQVDADASIVRAVCAEAVADALPRNLGARPAGTWMALLECGPGPQQVLEALRLLVAQRVVPAELAREPYPDARLVPFAGELARRSTALAALLAGALPAATAKPNRNLAKAERVARALGAIADLLTPVARSEDFPRELELDKDTAKRLREFEAGVFTGAEQKALGESAAEVVRAAAGLPDDIALAAAIDVSLARAARGVLLPLLSEVAERLRARGVLTYEDLLSRARDLVRDDAAVRAQVRRDIDQLLVDEFQDTDVVQCELVRWIALDGARGERPGLFVVGDPKQSIYGWRSADLEAYEGLLRELEAAGGRRARLSVNYRSSQVVLDEVERLVAPCMQPEAGLQPEFQPLIEGRKQKSLPQVLLERGRTAIELWSAEPASDARASGRAEAARRVEARRIARELAELAAGGVKLERCALLLRNGSQQELYLEALREAGVPYSVGKDRGYFQTREVVDAVALVACLLDPSDALALATFLRTPVCGVPDAALAPLWRAGLPELAARLDGRTPQALERAVETLARAEREAQAALAGTASGLERIAGWRLCAESGLRALDHLRGDLAELSADLAVERLRAWLCPEASEAARFPGPHRLANLEHFFAALVEALVGARGGARGVLRELRAGLSGEREARSAAPDEVGESAVRVLTVHGAKGLQFQCVWLADLHHGSGSGSAAHAVVRVERLGDGREIELFGSASLERPRLDARREAVGAAEAVRLLYVAATRAEDRLVLSGLPGNAAGGRSLADLVARRAGDAWSELEQLREKDGSFELARDGARFVLAAAAPASEVELAPSRTGAAAAALDLSGLRAARARAEAHAARPLHAAISSSERARERAAREQGETGAALSRDTARALGVAVHAALERWPVGRADARAVARAALEAELAVRVPAQELPQAALAARALLEAFADSDLARRLDALAGRFHARELALVLPARGDAGPTSAWVGAVDLVHEENGGLVLVDFKTDRDASDAELVEAYGPQLRRYAEALGSALGRPVLRAELWRIGEGRALGVPLSDALARAAPPAAG